MPEEINQPSPFTEQPDKKRKMMLIIAMVLLVTAIVALAATIVWQRAQMVELLKQNEATSEALKKATEQTNTSTGQPPL